MRMRTADTFKFCFLLVGRRLSSNSFCFERILLIHSLGLRKDDQMSTVGDENFGPGVSVKGAGGSQDGSLSSALKRSNKANILSPPPSPRKKLDRGDGLATTNENVIKENLDQTVTVDVSIADDEDIISFRAPGSMKGEEESDLDPFKPRAQIANSPVSGKQAVSSNVDPTQSRDVNAEQSSHVETKEETVDPSGGSNNVQSESQLSSLVESQTGDSAMPSEQVENSLVSNEKPRDPQPSEGADIPKTESCEEAIGDVDPFKPSIQLANSPAKPAADVDPFKPSTQLANSPVPGTSNSPGTLAENADLQTTQLEAADCKPTISEQPEASVVDTEEIPASIDSKQQCVSGETQTDLSEPSSEAVVQGVHKAKDGDEVSSTEKSLPEDNCILNPSGAKIPASSSESGSLELDPFKPNSLASSPDTVSTEGSADLKQAGGLERGDAKELNAEEGSKGMQACSGLSEKKEKTVDVKDDSFKQLKGSPVKQGAEDIDPFKPKAQLVNSPAKDNEEIDPFKPTSQITNSPAKDIIEDIDPFKPKTQIATSPKDVTKETDPFKPKSQVADSPIKDSAENNPFKPKTQIANSPAKDNTEEIDSFKPKTQISNSPSKDVTEEIDPFKPKTHIASSPSKDVTEESAFKPKAQIANSPAKDITEETDPFKPKTQVANSPIKDIAENNPFKPKTQAENSPAKDITKETDPFKPKTQVANSPAKDITEETDPFKPKTKIANSPVKEIAEDIDPFKPKTKIANSPVKNVTEDIDPLKPKSMVGNSPVKDIAENDPFKPKTQIANSPVKDVNEDIDPFKPKTQIANSPAKDITEETDPFKPKTQIANSPSKDTAEETDPFKPKTQIANSPAKDIAEETDPFKPKTQTANSPAKDIAEEIDPFKPKTQIANSPAKDITEETDPFKPKVQIANSPIKDSVENNPFKSKTQIANSPTKDITEETDPFKPKTQMANSPAKEMAEQIDPFKLKTQLASSPAKTEAASVADAVPVKLSSETSQDKNVSNSSSKSSTSEVQAGQQAGGAQAQDTANEASQVLDKISSMGAAPENSVFLASGQDLGLDEDMFVSGTQVFNDPATWDLLEQFGQKGDTKEADLRKCSLYVKFDPLVKSTLPKTPEKMPAPAHAAPRRATGKPNDLMNFSALNASQANASMQDESICLMGTPPKVSRRRSVLSQRRMNMSSLSKTITEEETVKPVDLLFSLEGDHATDDMFLNDPAKTSDAKESTLVDVEQSAKYTEHQWQELQQRLAMQYEGQMLAKQQRMAAREQELASQMEEKDIVILSLQEQIAAVNAEKATQGQKLAAMASCMAEYEKTLNTLIEDKESAVQQSKAQVEELKKERDQALEDVQAVENCFTELHRRYEKLKLALDGFKKNEETMKEAMKTMKDKVQATEANLVKVKTKAEEKVKEMLAANHQKDSEMARVEAELKRAKVQVSGLESSLEQKIKANKELTELCDNLIAQVGGK